MKREEWKEYTAAKTFLTAHWRGALKAPANGKEKGDREKNKGERS